MDVPVSQRIIRNRKIKRGVYIAAALVVVAAISVFVMRLKPADPPVDKGVVVIETVKRGEMLRQVRGMGRLVPETIIWITASTNGKVEKRLIQPGAQVTPDTVIFELSNPELQQQVMDAGLALRSAEAAYTNRKVELEANLMNQKAQAATVDSEFSQAKLTAESNEQLNKSKIVSDLIMKQSRMRATELKTRSELEKKRIAINEEAVKTQLAVAQSQLEQSRALHELRKSQAGKLKVVAGMHGVLQELAVQVGQQVAAGANLARVSDPGRLKAELQIPETQARDVQIGQTAEIDTRNGLIRGRVLRLDPAVTQGNRIVDIQLLDELPKGAVPDLNVDGTILLERLTDVIYVNRPAFGQENGNIQLFKIESDGIHAQSVNVKLGRYSVTYVEIVSGLKPGDRVIISDTSSQVPADAKRIRLN